MIDATNDPSLKSWVPSANVPGTDFPIQNLPFGIFRRTQGDERWRAGIAIGDQILDLGAAADLLGPAAAALVRSANGPTLNAFMAAAPSEREELRRGVSALLKEGSAASRSQAPLLVPMADATLSLPAAIGDYTDFYASINHATNVGSMFRPDNPLLPNYKHVPIGYHGRASSIVASGTPVRRPQGQTRDDANAPPVFGPTRRFDYEVEVAFFVGTGNALGTSIPIDSAERHIFGFCLLNDWSARDIQTWEYQPLGPFLAKNFASTISPWVVTLEALAPFRIPALARPTGDPEPLPYLSALSDRAHGGIDLTLELSISSARMRESNIPPMLVSRSSFGGMYWTAAQMLTHHASNGCNLRPGDLLGSGTVSGPTPDSRGCLLERTWRGTEPLTLPSGETRKFLEDWDEVILTGYCAREGLARIGFGECRGIVIPAA